MGLLMPKKILLKTPYDIKSKIGGMENVVYSLYEFLLKKGHQVAISHLHNKVNKYDAIIIFNIYSINNLFFVIKNYFYKERMIYFTLWHDPYLQAIKDKQLLKKIKTFLRVAFDMVFNNLQSLIIKNKIFYSEFEKNRFKHGKSIIVAGPLNKKNQTSLKKETINYDAIFIGRYARNKGIDDFIKLAKIQKDKRFAIISPDNIPSQSDNIEIFLNINEQRKYEIINSSKCIVIPSTYESFSLVALECINYGLIPIISENVMGKDYFKTLCKVHIFKAGEINDLDKVFNKAMKEKFYQLNLHDDNKSFYFKIESLINEITNI